MDEGSTLNAETSSAVPKVNPKPLIILLLILAFFGGPCAVQKLISGEAAVPSEKELADALAPRKELSGLPAETSQKLIGALHSLLEEQSQIAARFQDYDTGFGFLVVAAYSFALISAIRAYQFLPRSAAGLSTACLILLPVRAAAGAIDLAKVRQLGPALEEATATYARIWFGLSQDKAEQAGNFSAMFALAVQVGLTAGICMLFTIAWRYFQRPEVLEYYERKAALK